MKLNERGNAMHQNTDHKRNIQWSLLQIGFIHEQVDNKYLENCAQRQINTVYFSYRTKPEFTSIKMLLITLQMVMSSCHENI